MYIFLRTWKARATAESRSLPVIQYIPAFVGLSDFLVTVFHGTDHLLSFLTGRISDGLLCKVLGVGTTVCISTQAIWVFILGYSTWRIIKYDQW